MKILAPIIISLLFSFCSFIGDSRVSSTQDVGYSIESISKAEFDKVFSDYKKELVRKDINKNEGRLILMVEDSTVVFVDTLKETDNPRQREFEYIGEISSINKYVVRGTYWEYSEDLLVDKLTGKIDTLWSAPLLSPNAQYLAAKSLPYGIDGLMNGIQIVKLVKGEMSEFVEIDQQEWIPKDLAWSTNNELVFSFITVEDFWENQSLAELSYAKIILME